VHVGASHQGQGVGGRLLPDSDFGARNGFAPKCSRGDKVLPFAAPQSPRSCLQTAVTYLV